MRSRKQEERMDTDLTIPSLHLSATIYSKGQTIMHYKSIVSY